MADEPIIAAAAPAPPAPAPEPVAAAPAVPVAAPAAPAVEPVAAAPVEKPAAPVEAPKPADAAAKPHTETPTLLEGVAKPEEKPAEKPAEAKPGEKPAEAKPGDKPAEAAKPEEAAKPVEAAAPVYELKLPETIKAEPVAMSELTKLFGDSKVAPETAQKIVDIGTAAMTRYAAHLQSEQHRVFGETRANWVKEVLADPVLGGAGHKTAMGAIARMRDQFVPADKQTAFNDFLRVTGAGDHPAFLHLLHNAARFFDEPGLPPANAKPSPANGRAPGRRGLRDIYAQGKAARSG